MIMQAKAAATSKSAGIFFSARAFPEDSEANNRIDRIHSKTMSRDNR